MRTEPELLRKADQDELVSLLGSPEFKTMCRVVAGMLDRESVNGTQAFLLADVFPKKRDEAEEAFSRARRYRNFLEVARELVAIAQDNDIEFASVKLVPTDLSEVQ